MVVTNTGNVDLTNVSVVDNLPAGLTYTSTVSNTCGGAVNAVGGQITYGPFNLAVGASCTIVLRVGRTAECAGEQVNNAAVEGTFQSACFNGGQPVTVSDQDCREHPLRQRRLLDRRSRYPRLPGRDGRDLRPGRRLQLPVEHRRDDPLHHGRRRHYSLVVTEIASGCVSTNPCSVTITEDPRPTCSIDAPDTRVCPGETVQICGPVGDYTYLWNTGATTRCLTVGAGTYSLVITSTVTGCVSNNNCA